MIPRAEPAALFGPLMSLGPAIGAGLGFALLGQGLGAAASAGATLSARLGNTAGSRCVLGA